MKAFGAICAQRGDAIPMDNPGTSFSVFEVFGALWKSRVFIAAVTVAAMLVTGIVLMLMPRHYTATATLLVLPAPPEDSEGRSPASDRFGIELLQAQLGSYRAIIASRRVAQQVVTELGLNKPPRALEPLDFLRKSVEVTLLREALSLEVEVTLGSAELAAQAANRMAEISIEDYRAVRTRQAVETREFLSGQLKIASAQRDEIEKAYLEYRSQTQIELLKATVESLVEQKERLLGLNVQIESVRARILSAQEELAKHQPVRVLRQSIMDDSVLREVVRAAGDNSGSLMGLSVESERLDSTYSSLEALVATSTAELAALEGERRELLRRSGLGESSVELLSEFYVKETQLDRLESEFELAKTIQAELAKRDEEAWVDSLALYPQVQLVDPAIAPTRPSRPQVVLTLAVVGALTALMAASVGTLYWLVVST